VTLLGQGHGAALVHLLMVSPVTRGTQRHTQLIAAAGLVGRLDSNMTLIEHITNLTTQNHRHLVASFCNVVIGTNIMDRGASHSLASRIRKTHDFHPHVALFGPARVFHFYLRQDL